MKLHNVIGGLEEMEYVNNTYDGPISIGHNQLCNREVEIDDEIINIYPDLVEKSFPKGKCKERGHALVLVADIHLAFIKALSQGKVIKVKE